MSTYARRGPLAASYHALHKHEGTDWRWDCGICNPEEQAKPPVGIPPRNAELVAPGAGATVGWLREMLLTIPDGYRVVTQSTVYDAGDNILTRVLIDDDAKEVIL